MQALFFYATFLSRGRKRGAMKLRKVFLIFVLCLLSFFQLERKALALDAFSTLKQWWNQHAIGDEVKTSTSSFSLLSEEIEVDNEVGTNENVENEDQPETSNDEAFVRDANCIVPSALPIVDCQNSSDQLCVEYLSGGTTQSVYLLKGKVDLTQRFSGLSISLQNAYTRETSTFDKLESRDVCDESRAQDQEICLTDDGYFLLPLQLDTFGPYTVVAHASFSDGGDVQKQIRISRVIPIEKEKVELSFSPSLQSEALKQSTHLNITADLLGSCANCDFIGAATAGVRVVARNTNYQDDQQSKNIECVHQAAQSDGKYIIGVPLQAGENNITLNICNAALEKENACLSFGPFVVNREAGAKEFELISPEERDFYASNLFPEIKYEFRFADKNIPVTVQVNHEEEKEIRTNSNGVYHLTVTPQVGVNVLSFVQGNKRKTITFTWGELVLPHSKTNRYEIENAASLFVKSNFIETELQPLLSNYFRSDEFKTLLGSLVQNDVDGDEDLQDENETQQEMPMIPRCATGDKESPYVFSLREAPEMEKIEIQNIDFSENEFSFRVNIDRLRVRVNMSVDNKGKQITLPMLISFRKIILDLQLENKKDSNGQAYVLVNAPQDDCDFRSKLYCDNRPSSLTPDHYLGDATKYRHIIRCEEEKTSGNTLKICRALNALDSQTAAISTQVFETINEQMYCSGSQLMTGLMYNGINSNISLPLSFLEENFSIPLNFQLGKQFAFHANGIYVPVDLSLEANGKNKKGILISSAKNVSEGKHEKALSASVGFDLINALLFSFTAHYPEDTLNLHNDVLTNADGVMLSERCGDTGLEIKKEDAILCQLRPRVLELLGTSLSEGNYLEKDQPLLLRFRMDTRHVPRLQAKDEHRFELQLSGLRVDFYALEYDKNEDGSVSLRYDSHGQPIIKSMRPEISSVEEGQIISAELSLLMGIELGDLSIHPEDASSLTIPLKIMQEKTKIFLDPIPGTNATQIPGELLTGTVLGKLQIGLDSFSKEWLYVPGKGVLKKQLDVSAAVRDLLFGTSRIGFVSDSVATKLDTSSNRIEIGINPVLYQVLHYEGKREEFRYE